MNIAPSPRVAILALSAGTAFATTSTQERREILAEAAALFPLPSEGTSITFDLDGMARTAFLEAVPRDMRPAARRLVALIPEGEANRVFDEIAHAIRWHVPTLRAWAFAFALYQLRRHVRVSVTGAELTSTATIEARTVRSVRLRRRSMRRSDRVDRNAPGRRPRAHAPPHARHSLNTQPSYGSCPMRS